MFSDQCTVSDEAFGRFTIERCWDIWLKECKEELNKNDFSDNNNDTKKYKIKYQYAVKKTNKRFGGWTSDGMKRYDEIANLVKSDRNMNKKVEIEYKDFMFQKMYGDKEEKQQTAAPDVILSDVHEKLGETYVPYNDFGSPYITNEKEFTSTSTNNERMHITPEKNIVSDTILSNDIYFTQQKYLCDGNGLHEQSDLQQNYQHDSQCLVNMPSEQSPDGQYLTNMQSQRDCSNGNTPSDISDHESDDENFDDEIQVSPYERKIIDNSCNIFFNINSENTVHSMVKIRMNLKMKVKMMISKRSNIACIVDILKHNY